jgi:hypothetical protein
MELFLNGLITMLSFIFVIKELGLVNVKNKNYWFKIIVIEVVLIVLAVFLGSIDQIFVDFSLLFLIIPLLILLRSDNSLIRIVLSCIIAIAIMIILDMIIYPTITYIAEYTVINNRDFIIRIVSDILILFSGYFISRFMKKFTGKVKQIVNENNLHINIFVMIFLIVFIIFSIGIVKYEFDGNSNSFDLLIISVLLAISYVILIALILFLVYRGFKKNLQNEQKQREINDVIEYAEKLEEVSNGMREYRYDYIRFLSNLLEDIENNKVEELDNCLREKIAALSNEINQNNSNIELIYNIKNKEIKAVMISKVLMAQELGIGVFIEIPDEITAVTIETLDFCNCIKVIMDFAIESCKISNNDIKIGLMKRKAGSTAFIISFKEENYDSIYKVFTDQCFVNGQGDINGLSNLREITINYPNVYLDSKLEGGVFSLILELE